MYLPDTSTIIKPDLRILKVLFLDKCLKLILNNANGCIKI